MSRILVSTLDRAGRRSKRKGLSRREALQWVGAVATLPLAACEETASTGNNPAGATPWPSLDLPPVTAEGYGQDPDYFELESGPWPRLLTAVQRRTVAAIADALLPAEGDSPAASDVGVVDFLDEWVSAPYPSQQRDRERLVPGLVWIEAEAERRSAKPVSDMPPETLSALLADLEPEASDAVPSEASPFFARLRALLVGAYYTTPAGWDDLGHIPDAPLTGDWPGPSPEALDHLRGVVADLGLAFPESEL